MANGPRVLVVTGPGKGKTTAALGIVLRSLGHGRPTLLTRFAKAVTSGELAVLSALPGFDTIAGGCGMTPPPDSPDYPRHVAEARRLFELTRGAAPRYGTLVLDEICGIAARGMITEEEIISFLDGLAPEQIAVLTGRGAGAALIARADTVSEILSLKHGYMRGIDAMEGVEL